MILENAGSAEMRASVFGAGILGFGLGALLRALRALYHPIRPWLACLGMCRLHGVGKKGAFSDALYRSCWLALAAPAGCIAIRLLA